MAIPVFAATTELLELLGNNVDGAAASGDCELWWEADRGRLVVGGWPRPDAFTPCGGGPGLLVDGGSGYRPDPTAVRLDGGDLILEQGPTVRFLADGVQEIEWGLGQPVRLVHAG